MQRLLYKQTSADSSIDISLLHSQVRTSSCLLASFRRTRYYFFCRLSHISAAVLFCCNHSRYTDCVCICLYCFSALCGLPFVCSCCSLRADPEHSYGGIVLFKALSFAIEHHVHFIPFLAVPLWLFIFGLDYVLGTSLEWIPMTVMTGLSVSSWGLLPLVIFVVTFLITWYIIPFGVISVAANVVVHFVVLSLLRMLTTYEWQDDEEQQPTDKQTDNSTSPPSTDTDSSSEDNSGDNNNSSSTSGKRKRKRKPRDKTAIQELKELPLTYYLVFALLLYLDFGWRNRPTFWSVLGVITADWGIFLVISMSIAEFARVLEQRQQQQQQQQHKSKSSNRSQPPSPSQSSHPQSSEVASDRSSKRCEQCHAVASLKLCATCKEVYYCSRECQQAHWPEHKSVCKRA